MKVGERLRSLLAATGVCLWLATAFVYGAGEIAKHVYRCRDRTFTGNFDECFNDYLPIFEVVFVPIWTALTAYPFTRFACSLYAPQPVQRTLRRRFAGSSGASSYWPALHLAAVGGLIWCVWCLSRFALIAQFGPFHLYWIVFAVWFAVGAVLGASADRAAAL